MRHETSEKASVKVLEGGITFENFYLKPYVTEEISDSVKQANILLIPHERFRAEHDYLFPEITLEFFSYLQANLPDGIKADIGVSDSQFKAIELHSSVINIPNLLVETFALGLVVNLLSSWLYDILKSKHKRDKDFGVKVQIIAEDRTSNKTTTITYEGEAAQCGEALKDIVEKLCQGRV